MALRIPKRNLGNWSAEIISNCSTSAKERSQRGAIFRNLYLSGTESGDPATYPKSNKYIGDLASYLYSPVELRYRLTPGDSSQADERAMSDGASIVLHRELRRRNVDMQIRDANLWGLVKGKAFLKLLWNGSGFDSYVVQPELMGVLREDLDTLDAQEAFFHTTYLTFGRFSDLIRGHPNEKKLLKEANRIANPARDQNAPDNASYIKQVIIGGLNPFRGPSDTPSTGTNMVDWLGGPKPSFAPQVINQLIRLDELWVRDADRDGDWTTIQTIGENGVIEGDIIHRNLFADPSDIKDQRLLNASRENNPLTGRNPFTEFSPNPLKGYFWGVSELNNVALLQSSLNARLNGIQRMLRLQEDPPRMFIGGTGPTATTYSNLRKPGGYLTEITPSAKVQDMAPQMPKEVWADLQQIEAMYDDMGGFTPTLQGRGDSGVRSQSQAETLVRTSTPRFKDKALLVERSVSAVGDLALAILRAKYAMNVVGWVKPGEPAPSAEPRAWWTQFFMSPAKGVQRVTFLMHQLPQDCTVTVDSHSSSPAFSYEAKELAFALAGRGAIDNPELIALTHPPNEEALILSAQSRDIERAALIAAHPELLMGKKQGRPKGS